MNIVTNNELLNCRQTKNLEKARRVASHLVNHAAAFDYPGGIPTSLLRSGQQWDFR